MKTKRKTKRKTPQRVRLTQARAESLKLDSGLHFDSSLHGFGISCGKVKKTWFAQRDVKDGSRRFSRRVKLGPLEAMKEPEARIEATKMLARMADGYDPSRRAARARIVPSEENGKPQTAGDWFERFRQHKEGRVSSATYYEYEYAWGKMNQADRLPSLRGVPLSRRSMADLGRNPMFMEDLYGEIARIESKPIANGCLKVFGNLYNYASARDYDLPANPCRVIERYDLEPERREKRKTDHLKPEQLPGFAEIIMTLREPVRRAMWMFFLFSGQRAEQTVVMRWEHVRFVKPDKSKQARPNSIWIPDPKGGPGAAFELPLNSSLIQILEFLESLRSEPEHPFAEPKHQPWVFPAHSASGHIHKNVDERKFEKPYGTKDFSHRLRRTYISVGDHINIPDSQMEWLKNHGQSGRGKLAKHYSRPFATELHESTERISAYILEHLGYRLVDVLRPGE